MKEREYELMVLIDPEEKEKTVLDLVEDRLGEFNFDIQSKDSWGLRTLAFPIKKRTQARYVVLDLKSKDYAKISELEKELLIIEGVLRFSLVIKGR